MILKFVCHFALLFALAQAAPKKVNKDKKSSSGDGGNERISAFFIKDSSNGELRFLTGTGGTGGSANINQLITQKQNLLEQLRPTNNGNINGANVTPIIVNLGGSGGTNTPTTSPTLTGTGTGGGGGGVGGGGGGFAPIAGASPIAGLLPQIAAQGATGNRRRVSNRRRGSNRRRAGNRRRPAKRGPVYVIRGREF